MEPKMILYRFQRYDQIEAVKRAKRITAATNFGANVKMTKKAALKMLERFGWQEPDYSIKILVWSDDCIHLTHDDGTH